MMLFRCFEVVFIHCFEHALSFVRTVFAFVS